jgi:hypothetical protein
VNSLGNEVVEAVLGSSLKNYVINLMTMDYGSASSCPMTSNFPFCQLAVLDWSRLPLSFPRPAADGLLAGTFMQPGNLPKRSPKRPDRQTSLSRVAGLRPTKRANRTLCRPKIDNTDSSSQVSDVNRGIFDVMGHLCVLCHRTFLLSVNDARPGSSAAAGLLDA